MKRHRLNVFVNAPFDDDYAPLFDSLIFAIRTPVAIAPAAPSKKTTAATSVWTGSPN